MEKEADAPAARSPQSNADASVAMVQPPKSVTVWCSYHLSAVMKTSPRWGMAGPVLVSLTTSCARPPTATVCVAEDSTVAVGGTGVVQPPRSSISATTPAPFISLPYPLPTHPVCHCLMRGPPIDKRLFWAPCTET